MQCAVISMAVILLLWCELIKAGEITRDHPVLLWMRLLGPRKIKVEPHIEQRKTQVELVNLHLDLLERLRIFSRTREEEWQTIKGLLTSR